MPINYYKEQSLWDSWYINRRHAILSKQGICKARGQQTITSTTNCKTQGRINNQNGPNL